MAKQGWSFLDLVFAFSWINWIAALKLGASPGAGEYVLAFGTAGPAVAAIFLARNKQHNPAGVLLPRLICFATIWLLASFVYLANDHLRGIRPSSQFYGLAVGALALIPAWIVSSAFSRDSGVHQLLRTLVKPGGLRWPAVGFLFFRF